jgi:hypothetical protein
MNRILSILLLLVGLVSSFQIVTIDRSVALNECCASCELPLLKYYSIPNANRCGVSCFNPKDYAKYKLFEPKMQLATSNTPCADNGFGVYNGTEAHGFSIIKAIVDVWVKA